MKKNIIFAVAVPAFLLAWCSMNMKQSTDVAIVTTGDYLQSTGSMQQPGTLTTTHSIVHISQTGAEEQIKFSSSINPEKDFAAFSEIEITTSYSVQWTPKQGETLAVNIWGSQELSTFTKVHWEWTITGEAYKQRDNKSGIRYFSLDWWDVCRNRKEFLIPIVQQDQWLKISFNYHQKECGEDSDVFMKQQHLLLQNIEDFIENFSFVK